MENRVTINDPLFTQKYTKVEYEADFKFNAPHHFEVKNGGNRRSCYKGRFPRRTY